jgi:hypothetical protein
LPRRKADKVHSIRLELQQNERDALDIWVASKAIDNIGTGVGQLLMPFSGAISAVMAAWIAKEGAEAVWDAAFGLADRLYGDEVEASIAQYKQAQNTKLDNAKEIVQKAHDEDRPLTEKEQQQVEKLSEKETYEEYQKSRPRTLIENAVRIFFKIGWK